LLKERLNFGLIPDRVWAANYLGAPYERELTDSVEMAKAQAEQIAADIIAQGGTVSFEGELIKDSTAIALIAYLQRMGKDLFAPAPVASPGAEPPAAPADGSVPPADEPSKEATTNTVAVAASAGDKE
jgi:cytochrome c oxidase cbb3-type subunit I/II